MHTSHVCSASQAQTQYVVPPIIPAARMHACRMLNPCACQDKSDELDTTEFAKYFMNLYTRKVPCCELGRPHTSHTPHTQHMEYGMPHDLHDLHACLQYSS